MHEAQRLTSASCEARMLGGCQQCGAVQVLTTRLYLARHTKSELFTQSKPAVPEDAECFHGVSFARIRTSVSCV